MLESKRNIINLDAEVEDHPEGDPNKRSHMKFFEEMNRVGIQFYFGKIRNSTNKMIEKFSEAYGKNIVDFDINQVENIFSSVVAAVTDSVSHSLSTILATNSTSRELRSFNLSALEPDWDTIEIKDCIFFTYEVPESIDDVINGISLERKAKEKGGRIQVADDPFAEGNERIAYYGKNVSTYRSEVKEEKSDDDDPSQNLTNDMRAVRIGRGRRSGTSRMPTNPRGNRLRAQQIPHQIAQCGSRPIPFNAMQSIPSPCPPLPYPFPQSLRSNAPGEFHTPTAQRVPNANNPKNHSSVNSRSPRGRGRGSRARGNGRSLPEKKFEINTIDELVVLKEFKYTKTGTDSAARYHLFNYTQTIASYLAQKFEEELGTIQKEVIFRLYLTFENIVMNIFQAVIKFIKIKIVQIGKRPPYRFMSCERRYSENDSFIKFTNNTSYQILESKAKELGIDAEFIQLLMAFSHYTYKVIVGL